jgi:predicted ATP-grasp superfamily ATP-dependent carboligase
MNPAGNQGNILFTGGRSTVTLHLTRLFNQGGYKVYIADSIKDNLSGASKYAEKNLLIPSPAIETEKFIDALIDIIKKYNIQTLIPTCEEVFYISRWKEKLDPYCFVFTASIEVLTRLHSKYQFINLLKDLGLPNPQTKLLTSAKELSDQLDKIEKFVLKPEFSRFASQVLINDKSPEKLAKVKISEKYPWVFQEFLQGQAFCSYSVVQEGKVLAHSIYPSIYCAGQGATVYFESAIVPEIDDIVFKIAKVLNYTGQLAFDFIRSDRDGCYYPIECNPRPTSGVHLFSAKENLPLAFKQNIRLNNMIRSGSTNTGVVSMAMILYCLPKIKTVKGGADFIKKMLFSKDVIFQVKDLKPFFIQFKALSHLVSEARKDKTTILEASTKDIEWNGNWD